MEGKREKIEMVRKLYYANPEIQKAILNFSREREVVPRYFEGFGKRPDTLIYPSDLNGLVRKGATSFHASEEIWNNPLEINSEMPRSEIDKQRKSWDLVIDIDSKYLDYSKTATLLMIEALEEFGIKNYGIKFSGSKGFHIIISGKAFPDEYKEMKTKEMFPEWPRAICEFLTSKIRKKYNEKVSKMGIDFDALKARTNLSREDIMETICPECGRKCEKGKMVTFECPECRTSIKRKDPKITKRKLSCINDNCAGKFEITNEKDYFFCEYCGGLSSISRTESSGRYKATYSDYVKSQEDYSGEFVENISGNALAGLDLVLVAPRHLFRAPYSLHEKTALVSAVIGKNEIEKFDPLRDADPLRVKVREFLPENEKGEGKMLLSAALSWKAMHEREEEKMEKKKFGKYGDKPLGDIDIKNVTEDMFPQPIKKLLKGLEEGRKRGLFILLTFLRSLNFDAEYIREKVKEWNNLNKPPLRDSYMKGQIEWHLKQKRKILPPNYANEAFYKDLGLIDKKQEVKNPIVEVIRKARERS